MEHSNLLNMLEGSGVENAAGSYELLLVYAKELHRVGNVINLSGYSDSNKILNELIWTSISPLMGINVPRGTLVADMGSGQGIPGIPLSIIRPDLEMVLFEIREKRVAFLKHAVRTLGCNCRIERGRIEELGHSTGLRGKFGLVVARAFAPAYVAVECGAPLLKLNGMMYVYSDESLPGNHVLDHAEEVGLVPMTGEERAAMGISEMGYAFKKINETAGAYPRRFPVMKKASGGLS